MDAETNFQLISIASIAAIGAAGVLAPIIMARNDSSDVSTGTTFSYANMGSSGVFLAAGLVHMLPDATDDLSDLNTKLPVASMLVGIGFCLLLVIEQMTEHQQQDENAMRASFAMGATVPDEQRQLVGQPLYQDKLAVICETNEKSSVATTNCTDETLQEPFCQDKVAVGCETNEKSSVATTNCTDETLQEPFCQDKVAVTCETNVKSSTTALTKGTSMESLQQSLCQNQDDVSDSAGSNWATALVLWAALSVHSLLAGLALGADTHSAQWGVLIAILAHKGLAGFALCCSLLRANTQRCSLLATLISFVLATPSGVVLGMAISNILDGSENFTGVVKSLASGTFIFVPAMELIPDELASFYGDKRIKLFLLVIGFCGMSVLAIWC